MDVIGKIEELRMARGWTKYRLAEEALITYSTLSAIYARNTPPKLDVLELICNAFGLTLSQFFAGSGTTDVLSPDEAELLQKYRRLTAEQKQAALVLLDR